MEKYITAKELADKLSLSVSQIYYLSHNGKIPHYKIGGVRRYVAEEVDQYIKDNNRVMPTNKTR